MDDNDTLLNFVAQRHTTGLEDAATDALCFILSRSTSAREALSDLLELTVAKAKSWETDEHGAEPDLSCMDQDGNLVALIESKFWAQLTHHQPVTYWERLPDDRPSALLFLAPGSRVKDGSLWDEIVERLRKGGHELGPPHSNEGLIAAATKIGQRRLMLTSWESLLDKMAQKAKADGDTQAGFEIAQLQGLAVGAIKGDRPLRDEKLKQLIADAVKRVKQSGWANTDGLTTGDGHGYFARYLRLAGASAGLRIDNDALKRETGEPLWMWFYRDSEARVGVEEVGRILSSSDEPRLKWRSGDLFSPIVLSDAADSRATLDAIVGELERIAGLIDPNGPTYRRSTPTAGSSRPVTRPESRRSIENREQGHPPIKVVCWNIATMHDPWRELVEMDADVALLQEARRPPEDVAARVDMGPDAHWDSHVWNSRWWEGRFSKLYDRWPMVVKLSDRVEVEWFKQISPISEPHGDEIAVSGIGTVAAARVKPEGAPPFIAVSMYARWVSPHPSTKTSWRVGYSDGAAHSIISDLSAFIGSTDPSTHRILAAGDLNISFWSTDELDRRAQTVMDRFQALGLEYVGPQYPAGRRADPIPEHLNEESLDVPTYYSKSSNTPAGAYVQVDHVFASQGFHEEVEAKALNEVDEWGPSDHCRLAIEVGGGPS